MGSIEESGRAGRSNATTRALVLIAVSLALGACRGPATAHPEARPIATAPAPRSECAHDEHDDDAPAAAPITMHWSGSAKAIEVRAQNGIVRAGPASDNTIDIVARVRGMDLRRHGRHLRIAPRASSDARLRVIDRDGLLVACVVHGPAEDDSPDDCGDGKMANTRDGDLEIEVRVPKGVRFSGWTGNGKVEATHLDGDVEAHAQNGSIALETTGTAQASTVNGSIVAKIGAKQWDGTLALETVNGSVRVQLAEGAGARLSAETVHGKIGIGVRLDAARIEETRVEGKIGEGGGKLRLRSVNGGIDVR